MPATNPIAKPANPKKLKPQRLSPHCPATPGKTITAATAKIRDTQVIASETGDGSLEEEFTGEHQGAKNLRPVFRPAVTPCGA